MRLPEAMSLNTCSGTVWFWIFPPTTDVAVDHHPYKGILHFYGIRLAFRVILIL